MHRGEGWRAARVLAAEEDDHGEAVAVLGLLMGADHGVA